MTKISREIQKEIRVLKSKGKSNKTISRQIKVSQLTIVNSLKKMITRIIKQEK